MKLIFILSFLLMGSTRGAVEKSQSQGASIRKTGVAIDGHEDFENGSNDGFGGISKVPRVKQQIYISLVPKNSVQEYYGRWATLSHHLVVTDELPPKAISFLQITPSKKLFLVEPMEAKKSVLKDEIGRIGKFIVVEKDQHSHDQYDFEQEIQLTQKIKAKFQAFSLKSSKNILDYPEIDTEYLENTLKKFTGVDTSSETLGERNSISGRKRSRNFLTSEFKKFGFDVEEKPYGVGAGVNLIAKRKGKSDKFILVSAHYDTVRDTVGADDNASGTIGILSIAKAVQNFNFHHEIRFVAFDQEELGLIGSKAYAEQLDQNGEMENLIAVLNVDMMGYDHDSDGEMHFIDCEENQSPELTKIFLDVLEREKLKLKYLKACTNRSDHAVFWNYNKPAVLISASYFGNSAQRNPCYHRKCDQFSGVNLAFIGNILQGVLGTLLEFDQQN